MSNELHEPYTEEIARRDVGESTDWEVARTVSLLKWRQRAAGDLDSYPATADCGYCMVTDNCSPPTVKGTGSHVCKACPVDQTEICGSANSISPEVILQIIEDLEHPEEETQ